MISTKCLVVDDEAIAQRIIVGYLNDLPGMEVVSTALNAIEAMSILESTDIDLMFLDIEMPKLKGLAFLSALKHPPSVIITTAHREYALDSYDLEVIDYLLKPISFARFVKAINRYKKVVSMDTSSSKSPTMPPTDEAFIYVKSDRKTLKLNISEIQCIEGMNNYVILHLEDAKHIVYTSITSMMADVDSDFVRIHKSFVVNKRHVKGYTKELVMLSDRELPIGKTYKDAVHEL